MNKIELRQIYLNSQKSLSRNEREERSGQTVDNLFANFDFSAQSFLNCFITLEKNNEIDTLGIFGRFWRNFPRLITTAPRINFEMNVLENVKVTPDTKFSENKWQVLEPEGSELIELGKLDVVLVPLIAFDERGYRVGYGKGFYDKFLSKCRGDCRKIGLSLFPPVEKIADIEDFDVRLDFCVTPQRVWAFK